MKRTYASCKIGTCIGVEKISRSCCKASFQPFLQGIIDDSHRDPWFASSEESIKDGSKVWQLLAVVDRVHVVDAVEGGVQEGEGTREGVAGTARDNDTFSTVIRWTNNHRAQIPDDL